MPSQQDSFGGAALAIAPAHPHMRGLLRGFYFIYFVASGASFPFASLYFHNLHLTGSQIGLLFALAPLLAIPLQPLWGTLSDRFGLRAHLVRGGLIVAALLAQCMVFAHGFAAVAALYALIAIALSPVSPLIDTTTLQYTREAPSVTYGQIRMWGSAGFLVGAIGVGQVYNVWGIARLYPVFGILLILALVGSLAVPLGARSTVTSVGADQPVTATPRTRGAAAVLFGSGGLWLFYAVVLLGYGATAAYNGFYALYLAHLGASTWLIGLASGLAGLSEVPVMYYSGWAIRRWGSRRVIVGGTLIASARWILLSQLRLVPVAMTSQLLHGLTFATFYTGGVIYSDIHAPSSLRATAQTLFNAATFGLGVIGGSILFGWLFDHIGVFSMFLVAGAISALSAVLLIVFVRE